MLDLVVIGSGPHALSLVCRLLDDNPDVSGDFFIGLGSKPAGHRAVANDLVNKPRAEYALDTEMHNRIAVIDPSGSWLSQWDKQFSSLRIPFLRSDFGLHSCPRDSQSLKAWAEYVSRRRDDIDLRALEVPRSSTYSGPFRSPSADLFLDFNHRLIKAYKVGSLVRKGFVESVVPLPGGGFELRVVGGISKDNTTASILKSRRVVVATGPTSVPRWPEWTEGLKESAPTGSILHSWDLVAQSKAPGISTKSPSSGFISEIPRDYCTWHEGMAEAKVLIVGGGLTSAHLLHNAVVHLGCRKVTLLSRQSIKVQQFDLTTDWIGWGTRPKRLNEFLKTSNMAKRKDLLHIGRGSITPEGMRMIRAAQVCAEAEYDTDDINEEWDGKLLKGGVRSGLHSGSGVRVLEDVEVTAAIWLDKEETQEINKTLHSLVPNSVPNSVPKEGCWEVYLSNGETEHYDRIWIATGSEFDVQKDALLGPLLEKKPIEIESGLPILEPTLRWRPDTELYVMGPFAALQIGPDALNLAGGKTGACRIDAGIRYDFRAGRNVDNSVTQLFEEKFQINEKIANIGNTISCKDDDGIETRSKINPNSTKIENITYPNPNPTRIQNDISLLQKNEQNILNTDVNSTNITTNSRTLDSIKVKLNRKSGWCSVSLNFHPVDSDDDPNPNQKTYTRETRSHQGSSIATLPVKLNKLKQ